MSCYERLIEGTEGQPDPKPLAELTRVQLVARYVTLGSILDLLEDQERMDAGESFTCRGRVKREHGELSRMIWRLDHPQQPEPVPQAVLEAMAAQSAGRSA